VSEKGSMTNHGHFFIFFNSFFVSKNWCSFLTLFAIEAKDSPSLGFQFIFILSFWCFTSQKFIANFRGLPTISPGVLYS